MMKQIEIKRGDLEVVNAHALKVGELVACHGEVFRLTERNVSTSHDVTEHQGETVWFRTEHLGHHAAWPQTMPAHWIADWTVQGNRLATFCRIGDPEAIKRITA